MRMTTLKGFYFIVLCTANEHVNESMYLSNLAESNPIKSNLPIYTYLPIYLSIYVPTYLPTYLPIYLSIYLRKYVPKYLFI